VSPFFIKQLLLVPLNTARKDFKFCSIFVELFVFIFESPFFLTTGESNKISSQKNLLVPITPEIQDSPVMNSQQCIHHKEVESLWCILHREVETFGIYITENCFRFYKFLRACHKFTETTIQKIDYELSYMPINLRDSCL
jgi:hypothetical protein